MPKNFKLFFLCLALSLSSVACGESKEVDTQPAAPGNNLSAQEVVDFSFKDLAKETVSLSSFRNLKPVALFFWTTWCPYCRREIQSLNSKYSSLKEQGWEILVIDIGEPAYKLENYRDSKQLSLRLFLDENSEAANAFGVFGVPTYVVIDKKGRIVAKTHTFSTEEYKYLFQE